MSTVDYSMLPPHMQDGARLYVERGIEPGSFMRAVLENDLYGAASRADSINKEMLFEWVQWMYAEAPGACWGDRVLVDTWIDSGGMEGRASKEVVTEAEQRAE